MKIKISLVKRFAARVLPGLLALSIGVYMVPRIVQLAHYRDEQAMAYDDALTAMHAPGGGDQDALGLLKKSYESYKKSLTYTYWERSMFPSPDTEIGALSFFHAGNILRQQDGKTKDALSAYVQSLRINNGQRILAGVAARDDQLHQYGKDVCVDPNNKVAMSSPVVGDECQLRRLEKEADDTRQNLISLLNEHPELAKVAAKPEEIKGGQGNGKNEAKDGDKKSELPGVTPAPSHGHNDDRSI
ncbi:MAG TPA: hypothetical protein V6C81_10750 [Planktothrix sp.]|jgi:hypothetical protein